MTFIHRHGFRIVIITAFIVIQVTQAVFVTRANTNPNGQNPTNAPKALPVSTKTGKAPVVSAELRQLLLNYVRKTIKRKSLLKSSSTITVQNNGTQGIQQRADGNSNSPPSFLSETKKTGLQTGSIQPEVLVPNQNNGAIPKKLVQTPPKQVILNQNIQPKANMGLTQNPNIEATNKKLIQIQTQGSKQAGLTQQVISNQNVQPKVNLDLTQNQNLGALRNKLAQTLAAQGSKQTGYTQQMIPSLQQQINQGSSPSLVQALAAPSSKQAGYTQQMIPSLQQQLHQGSAPSFVQELAARGSKQTGHTQQMIPSLQQQIRKGLSPSLLQEGLQMYRASNSHRFAGVPNTKPRQEQRFVPFTLKQHLEWQKAKRKMGMASQSNNMYETYQPSMFQPIQEAPQYSVYGEQYHPSIQSTQYGFNQYGPQTGLPPAQTPQQLQTHQQPSNVPKDIMDYLSQQHSQTNLPASLHYYIKLNVPNVEQAQVDTFNPTKILPKEAPPSVRGAKIIATAIIDPNEAREELSEMLSERQNSAASKAIEATTVSNL